MVGDRMRPTNGFAFLFIALALVGCASLPSARDDVIGDGMSIPTLLDPEAGELEIRLFDAVDDNDAIGVANALVLGAEIDPVDIYGSTPLMRASSRGQDDVVALLLQYGADPNFVNPIFHTTPLLVASQFGQGDVIRRLVTAGADLEVTPYGRTRAIHVATMNDQPEAIRALAELGADVNAVDFRPPLVLAARLGYLECARALLDNGADPLIVFSGRNTAAQVARNFNFPELAELIESYYPDGYVAPE